LLENYFEHRIKTLIIRESNRKFIYCLYRLNYYKDACLLIDDIKTIPVKKISKIFKKLNLTFEFIKYSETVAVRVYIYNIKE